MSYGTCEGQASSVCPTLDVSATWWSKWILLTTQVNSKTCHSAIPTTLDGEINPIWLLLYLLIFFLLWWSNQKLLISFHVILAWSLQSLEIQMMISCSKWSSLDFLQLYKHNFFLFCFKKNEFFPIVWMGIVNKVSFC